jgi:hypothetical protein
MGNEDGKIKCDGCPEHSGLVANIDNVVKQQSRQGEMLDKLFEKLDTMYTQLARRPGWVVTIAFSIMTTIIGVQTAIIVVLMK